MKAEPPYSPLDKANLGVSVADALLERDPQPLAEIVPFDGAGIYAIYYVGDFPAYSAITALNKKGAYSAPIYVGKAVPPGARKGGFGLGEEPGQVLYRRLKEHQKSIEQTPSLDIADFHCRYLVVDDIWIPLGESLLVERFAPIWNRVIDGFGNHDPGKGRYQQQRSAWDTIHEGRPWAMKCNPSTKTKEAIFNHLTAQLKDL